MAGSFFIPAEWEESSKLGHWPLPSPLSPLPFYDLAVLGTGLSAKHRSGSRQFIHNVWIVWELSFHPKQKALVAWLSINYSFVWLQDPPLNNRQDIILNGPSRQSQIPFPSKTINQNQLSVTVNKHLLSHTRIVCRESMFLATLLSLPKHSVDIVIVPGQMIKWKFGDGN